MKRLLKFLARLYPSAWRNRYAAEFEALLEDRTPRARDAFDVLIGALTMQMTTMSLVRITLASCVFGLFAALAISFAVPPKYVSQALILVDAGADVAGHPSNNGSQNDIDAMLRNTLEDVLSRSSLTPIIQKYNLYSNGSAATPSDAAIVQMRKSITIAPVRPASPSPGLPGFIVYFTYPDPHIAQQVDADLVSLFTQANLRRRIASASGDGPRQPGETFSVLDAPNLPQKPSFPKRGLYGATGLLAGLAAGLMLTFVIRLWQRKPPTVDPL